MKVKIQLCIIKLLKLFSSMQQIIGELLIYYTLL